MEFSRETLRRIVGSNWLVVPVVFAVVFLVLLLILTDFPRTVPFQGEEIDLRPAVEEQIVMAIPMKSLCREACRGICLQCGADLNQGDCECRQGPFDNEFAVLKDFKVKN